ncbi:MAG: hypothetical protein ABSF29_09875 [Tepidisphaeraceae bacterium]
MSRPLPIGKWGELPQFSGTFNRFFFIPGCLIIMPGPDFCSEFFFSLEKRAGAPARTNEKGFGYFWL